MSTPDAAPEVAPPAHTPKSSRRELDDRIGEICRDWWAELSDFDVQKGKDGANPNRAALAQLRRIGMVEGPDGVEIDVSAAIGADGYRAYLALRSRLRGLLIAWKSADRLVRFAERDDLDAAVAVVAATLARVREHKPGKAAKLLGAAKRDEAPLMAEARFKRLIRALTAPDMLDQGRRIVMLLGRKAPVDDLGASLLLWTVDSAAKRRWSFAYYDDAEVEAHDSDDDAATPAPTSST